MARVGRAAAHGEVVATDHHRPAIDAASAGHEVGRSERGELAAVVVDSSPGERSDFVERTGIEQPLDPLSNSQPAGLMLPLDVRGAAHLARDRLAPPNLVDLGCQLTRYIVRVRGLALSPWPS